MKTSVCLLALVAACAAFPHPAPPPAPLAGPSPPPMDPGVGAKDASDLKGAEAVYLASPYTGLLPNYYSGYSSYALGGLPSAYGAYSGIGYPAYSGIPSPSYSYYLR